ncbi:uncharacterized protein F5891DRAFT_1126636 [Suillus fuscotomentosus]|uniref:DUF6830 domain-containing protein n=1 Tax=Suillus fuscotomentosus TaxID=1912939 RepID=A0AAD4EDH9_9AGAM|nr:uncharacterized protein F5891DRAFT_1126636 [Suillus fuscotomentosus]KAG1904224.1 hypothetical protein F5891DRAFT_1126636 [Suillus fuscotomentosus]
MFQCPSCSKGRFKDEVAVAHHMNQPHSGCGFTGSVNEEGISPTGDFIDGFPGASQTYGTGHTFLDIFNSDENSVHRATNLYYPFSGQKDWELASWLLHSGLSMGKIDSFLSLEIIQGLPLLFSSDKELRGRAEMLPSGPCWMSQVIETKHLTKSPVILYWRDPLDCISSLLNHPSFHDQLDFTPRKVYTTAQRLCCVYSEWMTGDNTWTMQSALPRGAMLLGTILSSDKTNISMMTGDRTSLNSFMLTALLPVPKFLHKKKRMRGILEDRLVHQCLDLVLEPLKWAAHEGIMLSDPIATARSKVDSNDIEAFFREAQKFRLNGVDKPFWQDWLFAEPSHFLTPENLHHLHREFYDHDVKWIICTVGETEIDFRFSALQPVTGFRHFHGGISKLKQVTGRAQRDIQCSIIVVSADAVPSAVMTAVRALMYFRYLVQSPQIDDRDIEHISTALAEFHANKHAITAAGFRRGKRNKPIDNWYIPKIELMQNIAPSIHNTGITMQWSADATEHAHITEIKDPARSSNNNNYNSQICHHLDRADKCRRFDLATSLLDLRLQTNLDQHHVDDDVIDFDVDNDNDLPTNLLSTVKSPGYAHPITNYFAMAKVLQHREVGTIPLPLCTFIVGHTAFHLAYSPRAGSNASLPFDKLQIWFKLRLQDMEFHDTTNVRPAQTLNCIPPSDIWTFGWYDTVIVNNEDGHSWPADGLRGHVIAQIRLIFRPIRKMDTQGAWKDRFLTYVQHFNNSAEREPAMHLHLLKRVKRSNGTRIGDVIPVTQLRAPVNVVPRFGASADSRLTQYNGMEHALEFWLNKYWDKNTFYPLSMYFEL